MAHIIGLHDFSGVHLVKMSTMPNLKREVYTTGQAITIPTAAIFAYIILCGGGGGGGRGNANLSSQGVGVGVGGNAGETYIVDALNLKEHSLTFVRGSGGAAGNGTGAVGGAGGASSINVGSAVIHSAAGGAGGGVIYGITSTAPAVTGGTSSPLKDSTSTLIGAGGGSSKGFGSAPTTGETFSDFTKITSKLDAKVGVLFTNNDDVLFKAQSGRSVINSQGSSSISIGGGSGGQPSMSYNGTLTPGGNGGRGVGTTYYTVCGGGGGASFFGAGGTGGIVSGTNASVLVAATAGDYGAGGGAGASLGNSSVVSSAAAGAGGNGILILYWA
ncbi:MAG: hypothetical protein LBN43_06260 [Oscillospiraceae bacterium]|jgi:hypothetical protein|nr:hypothetical protein [Oscillospiraceae bacterium]